MRVLFLGSVIKTEDCTKHIGPSVAGNKMQMGIIKELFRFYNENMSILTEYPVAAYPKEKVICVNDGIIELSKGIIARKVPFLNFFILKQLTLIINAFFQICRWAVADRDEPKVYYASMHSHMLHYQSNGLQIYLNLRRFVYWQILLLKF